MNAYLHLLEDGGAIVGHNDFAVGTHEHFVHALGSEGRLQETGNCAGCHDVDLKVVDSKI